MSNNSFLSDDEMLLINILNTMYNDNYRQIENLQESNNKIRTSITNILTNINNITSNRTRHRQNTTNTTNTTNSNIGRRVTSSNTLERLLNTTVLNNSPYVVDNIEYIPLQPRTNTNNIRNFNYENAFMQSFFEPIEVYPTQSQIEIAIRIARFGDILNPRNSSCPISLDTFNDSDNVSIIRECGHIFSTEELNSWFRSNCKCPICRYDIRNYTPSRDLSGNNVNIDLSGNMMNRDSSGNELSINDISTLLFNYYTRGTRNNR